VTSSIRSWWRATMWQSVKAATVSSMAEGKQSLILARGDHFRVVGERLGHASIAITLDTYSVRAVEPPRGGGLRPGRLARWAVLSSMGDKRQGRFLSLSPRADGFVSRILEGPVGFEPTTPGLEVRTDTSAAVRWRPLRI
jgi:hypothetical protein